MTKSDAALMKEYIEGNLESFHLLYSRIAPRWFHVVQLVATSEQERETLFLWLFQELHKSRTDFDPQRDFDSWIRSLISNSKRAELSLNYGQKLLAPERKFTESVLDWIDDQILPPRKTVLIRYITLAVAFALITEIASRMILAIIQDGRTMWEPGLGNVTEAFARGAVMGIFGFAVPMFFLTSSEKLTLRQMRIWLVPSLVVALVFMRMVYVFMASGFLSLPIPMTAWAVGLLLIGRLGTSFFLK